MSPTERKARAMGIKLVSMSRLERRFRPEKAPANAKVFAKFELPSQPDDQPGIKREVRTYAPSEGGAWRVAVRCLRQVEGGKLA
jgi:hypothetical protein